MHLYIHAIIHVTACVGITSRKDNIHAYTIPRAFINLYDVILTLVSSRHRDHRAWWWWYSYWCRNAILVSHSFYALCWLMEHSSDVTSIRHILNSLLLRIYISATLQWNHTRYRAIYSYQDHNYYDILACRSLSPLIHVRSMRVLSILISPIKLLPALTHKIRSLVVGSLLRAGFRASLPALANW